MTIYVVTHTDCPLLVSFLVLWWIPLVLLGFPGSTSGKEPACQCRRQKRWGFDPWVGKVPWRRILQYSCLDNPMDWGASGIVFSLCVCVCVCVLSCVQLFVTTWTVALQAPLSMGFPRWKYWKVGHHFLLQEIFLTQGSNLHLLLWQADSLPLSHGWRPLVFMY